MHRIFDSEGAVQRNNYDLFRDIVIQVMIPYHVGAPAMVGAMIMVEISEMGVDKNPFGLMTPEGIATAAVEYAEYHFNGGPKPRWYQRYMP